MLGGLGLVVGLAGLFSSLAGPSKTRRGFQPEPDSDFDVYLDQLAKQLAPDWRQHELNVVERMQNTYPGATVLDNPRIDLGVEAIKPDVVVLDEYGDVTEVREAKAVRTLSKANVDQAVKYNDALVPAQGTTLDVQDTTYVSDQVLDYANEMGIGVEITTEDD